MSDAGGALGGVVALLVVIGIIVLAVCWVIFPFVVASGMGRIEKLLTKQNKALAEIRDKLPELQPPAPRDKLPELQPPAPQPPPPRPKPYEVSGGFQ